MVRKKTQPFWNRQRYLMVLALLIVGVVLISPTLSPFTASDDDVNRDLPTYPKIPPPPDGEDPGTGYETGELIAHIALNTMTVYPEDSVKVFVSWEWDEGFTLSYEENIDGFVLAVDESANIYVYYTTSPTQLSPTQLTAVFGDLDRAYTATIPAQSAGTVVTVYAEVNVGGESDTSNTLSYTVSGTQDDPPGDDPPDMEGPGWDLNPAYTTGNAILEDGTTYTWDELQTGTVYGIVTIDLEFTSGWERVLGVTLIVDRIDGEGGGYFYWAEQEDGVTWVLEWNTRIMEDGEYHIEIGANIWESTTELPGTGGGGGGGDDYYYTAFSAFDMGGSGGSFTGFSNLDLFIISLVFAGIVGIIKYREMKLKYKKRRRK